MWAKLITSIVSDNVPIWLGLINIVLAVFKLMPFNRRSLLVTNKSSPTIWMLLFISFVRLIHEFQSSSKNGSSIDLIGYFLTKSK